MQNLTEWLIEKEILSDKVLNAEVRSCLNEAFSSSLALLTSVPPILASCSECQYNDSCHFAPQVQWQEMLVSRQHKLIYKEPILFSDFRGHVLRKGSVRLVEDDSQPSMVEKSEGINNYIQRVRQASLAHFCFVNSYVICSFVSCCFKWMVIGMGDVDTGEVRGVNYKKAIE